MSALSVAVATFSVLGTALFCTPVRRVWTPDEVESCNPFAHVPILLGFSFVNVMLDASLVPSRPPSSSLPCSVADRGHAVLAYPIFTISGLHLAPRHQAWFIFAALVTGIWPAVAATYRLYLVLYYLDVHKFVFAPPQNRIAITLTFEMACLLISAPSPAYRVLRRKI